MDIIFVRRERALTYKVASRHLSLQRDAGFNEWIKWMVQPFDVIWKHHKKFVQGPVDDAMDAIIKELVPELVKRIVEQEVDDDVDEFHEGALKGKWDVQRGNLADPDPRQTSDWREGYEWGYQNPTQVSATNLPKILEKRLVEEGLREVRHKITEKVVEEALSKAWHAVSPATTLKAIITAVKKHGWKLGVGFALFEVAEHFVVPSAISYLTGDPKFMALASLPIGEVVYAIVFRILGGMPKELDKADPDGHLDWYETMYGPVRIAGATSNSLEGCYPGDISFAWIDPKGHVHTNIRDHVRWAERQFINDPDYLKWRKVKDEDSPYFYLLSQGWVAMSNYKTMSLQDLRGLSRKTIESILQQITRCVGRLKKNPEKEEMAIREVKHGQTTRLPIAQFVKKWGGRSQEKKFWKALLQSRGWDKPRLQMQAEPTSFARFACPSRVVSKWLEMKVV